MGSIKIFNLNEYITQYGCDIYLETGTGICDCFSHAVTFPFTEYYSIDIDGELIKKAENLYSGENIHFIHNYSHLALEDLVPKLPKEKPVLFFLDAHFPGADFHKISYEESIRQFKEDAFPLLKEIKIIKKHRDISKDVFIIDDWKLYDRDKNYEHSELLYRELQEELGLITMPNQIINEFENTHNFEINLSHQGYLILTPKV
jgi:hypothetical protein